jgi:hypothetical protein
MPPGITAAEIIDEIGAPNEHRGESVCMIHSLMSVLQRRGVAFMLPDPADHPDSNEMQTRLDKPSRKYGKRLPKKAKASPMRNHWQHSSRSLSGRTRSAA